MSTCLYNYNENEVANINGLYTVNHGVWEHQLYNDSVVLDISTGVNHNIEHHYPYRNRSKGPRATRFQL